MPQNNLTKHNFPNAKSKPDSYGYWWFYFAGGWNIAHYYPDSGDCYVLWTGVVGSTRVPLKNINDPGTKWFKVILPEEVGQSI